MVDSTTQNALEAKVLNWRILLYADFAADTLRATSGLYDKSVSSSGDAELDGFYESFNHELIEVGSVKHNETGSDTVSISLNGILLDTSYILDRYDYLISDRQAALIQERGTNFLNMIGDKTRWQGRAARIWFYCVDQNENQIGSIIPYYTGYMNDITITGSPEVQRVELTIENYMASLSGAQNKTYLMQNIFDSGDLSGNATIGAANGLEGAAITGGGASFGYDMSKVYAA